MKRPRRFEPVRSRVSPPRGSADDTMSGRTGTPVSGRAAAAPEGRRSRAGSAQADVCRPRAGASRAERRPVAKRPSQARRLELSLAMQTHHGPIVRCADRTPGLSRSARHCAPHSREDATVLALGERRGYAARLKACVLTTARSSSAPRCDSGPSGMTWSCRTSINAPIAQSADSRPSSTPASSNASTSG